jgi:hypothetical protein
MIWITAALAAWLSYLLLQKIYLRRTLLGADLFWIALTATLWGVTSVLGFGGGWCLVAVASIGPILALVVSAPGWPPFAPPADQPQPIQSAEYR